MEGQNKSLDELKSDPFIAKHLGHIKLLTAKYSGKKIFIECYPTDEGAECFPNSNRAVKEISVEALDLYMKFEAIKAGASHQSERERELVKALEEIEEIVLKYHKINGNSPAANHCRNIALQALSNHKP